MKKVGFFRSIQLKFIIIYILLLIIAVQVIGSYVTSALENELLTNFKQSINVRIDLLGINLEQAFNKERTDYHDDTNLQSENQSNIADDKKTSYTTIKVIE